MLCTQDCKCTNCENYSGSEMLKAKRAQMKAAAEQADLVSKVGVVAAQAIRSNGVNVEAAKRAAEEVTRQRKDAEAVRRANVVQQGGLQGGGAGGRGEGRGAGEDFTMKMNRYVRAPD